MADLTPDTRTRGCCSGAAMTDPRAALALSAIEGLVVVDDDDDDDGFDYLISGYRLAPGVLCGGEE